LAVTIVPTIQRIDAKLMLVMDEAAILGRR
jgi:hypothetical protein